MLHHAQHNYNGGDRDSMKRRILIALVVTALFYGARLAWAANNSYFRMHGGRNGVGGALNLIDTRY